ncbi:hypothetical protein HK405_014408 [Cladochytrium tenue]|nr:hypothetical protein HK405_014408 [Cladochytrium tenue]
MTAQFKAAALAVTNLFRESQRQRTAALEEGYAMCLQDLAQFLAASASASLATPSTVDLESVAVPVSLRDLRTFFGVKQRIVFSTAGSTEPVDLVAALRARLAEIDARRAASAADDDDEADVFPKPRAAAASFGGTDLRPLFATSEASSGLPRPHALGAPAVSSSQPAPASPSACSSLFPLQSASAAAASSSSSLYSAKSLFDSLGSLGLGLVQPAPPSPQQSRASLSPLAAAGGASATSSPRQGLHPAHTRRTLRPSSKQPGSSPHISASIASIQASRLKSSPPAFRLHQAQPPSSLGSGFSVSVADADAPLEPQQDTRYSPPSDSNMHSLVSAGSKRPWSVAAAAATGFGEGLFMSSEFEPPTAVAAVLQSTHGGLVVPLPKRQRDIPDQPMQD